GARAPPGGRDVDGADADAGRGALRRAASAGRRGAADTARGAEHQGPGHRRQGLRDADGQHHPRGGRGEPQARRRSEEGVPRRVAAAGAETRTSMSEKTVTVRAPRGAQRTAKGWIQEAAKRMLMNNLDPEVAEKPEELIVYGGRGKAARTWEDFHRIVATLDRLED